MCGGLITLVEGGAFRFIGAWMMGARPADGNSVSRRSYGIVGAVSLCRCRLFVDVLILVGIRHRKCECWETASKVLRSSRLELVLNAEFSHSESTYKLLELLSKLAWVE